MSKESEMFFHVNGAIELEAMTTTTAETLDVAHDGCVLQRRLELELAAHEIELFTRRVEAKAAARESRCSVRRSGRTRRKVMELARRPKVSSRRSARRPLRDF